MNGRERIRHRVLRGLALNRVPGLHFPGNFLDVSFDRVGRSGVRLSLDPGPWCADARGEIDLAALSMLADLALGACVRAQLTREARVATVSFSLQFTGAPCKGRLRAQGEFQGFFQGAAARLGLGRVTVAGARGQVCYGTGSFMALQPPRGVTLHPVPLRRRGLPVPPFPDAGNLNQGEKKILARAEAARAC